MCRFVAYLGKEPRLLKSLLHEPKNSLVHQSRWSKETLSGLNGDGFGIGWYNQSVDSQPAVFKSMLPAWNDANLYALSSKVSSSCFIGHVRASTIGEVSLSNCHPFTHGELLFAHNGTIQHFEAIRRDLYQFLDADHFGKIKGQTDSEHFFFLVSQIFQNHCQAGKKCSLAEALIEGMSFLKELLTNRQLPHEFRLNIVLTNGKDIAAMRYTTSTEKPPITLFYSIKNSLIIASERLTDIREDWQEVPPNSLLLVKDSMEAKLTIL